MVSTKLEDVTRQGSCKILRRKLHLRGSLLLVLIQFLGGGVGLIAYLSLSGSGREVCVSVHLEVVSLCLKGVKSFRSAASVY